MNILKKIINRPLLNQYKDYPKIRTLFTKESLGITAYEESRESTLSLNNNPEIFKGQFRKTIQQTVQMSVVVEDLKKYVHLMSSSNDDIDLLYEALRVYVTLREQMKTKSDLNKRHLSYIFGPIIMRALAYHNLPEYAIKFFDDGNLTKLFDQLSTYQVLLDLLYDSSKFGDLLRIFEEIQERIISNKRYVPREINAIVFATYYRLNTPVHDELAYILYKELKESGRHKYEYPQSIALVAAICLKHNRAKESLEILSMRDDMEHNICYMRILSHAYLKQFNEVFRLLEQYFLSSQTRKTIPKQLLEKVERVLKSHGDDDQNKKYQSIFNELQRLDGIFDRKLHNVLCTRIPTIAAPYKPRKQLGHGIS